MKDDRLSADEIEKHLQSMHMSRLIAVLDAIDILAQTPGMGEAAFRQIESRILFHRRQAGSVI